MFDVLSRIQAKCSRLVWLEHAIILRKEILRPPDAVGQARLAEHRTLNERMLGAYRQRGNDISPERLTRRFELGLRFFELVDGATYLANTWIVSKGTRFIDEVGYCFALISDELWVRDIYVSPRERGRGLFALLLDQVLREAFPRARVLWSNTDYKNRSSFRAHRRYGFEETEALRSLLVARHLLFRHRLVREVVSGFHPERRIVWLGSEWHRYVEANLA